MRKRTLVNLGIVGASQIATMLLAQIGTLILAGILDPSDFGIYAAILVVYNLGVTLSSAGVEQAAIQMGGEGVGMVQTASTLRLILAIACVAAIIVLAPFISTFFGWPDLTSPLRMMSFTILISSAGFSSVVHLSRDLRFKELSVARIAHSISWPTIAIILAVAGMGYWSLVIAFLCGNLISVAVLWYYEPWKLTATLERDKVRRLLSYGKYPIVTGILVYLFFNIDKAVVGRILGPDPLGMYYVAFTLGTLIPTVLNNVVNRVMFPTYTRLSGDAENLRRGYADTLRYLAYVSVPIGFGLAAISRTAVEALLGDEWGEMVIPLAILSLVGVCSSLTSPAGSLFLATGNPHLSLRQTAAMFVPYVLLIVPATNTYGLAGVSCLMLSTAAVSFLWVIAMACGVLHMDVRAVVKPLAMVFAAASAMGLTVFIASQHMGTTLLDLLLLIALGSCIYLTALYIITRGGFVSDLRQLMGLLRSS